MTGRQITPIRPQQLPDHGYPGPVLHPPRPLPEGDYELLTASDGQSWVVPVERARQTVIINHHYGTRPASDWDEDEDYVSVRAHQRRRPRPRGPEGFVEGGWWGVALIALIAILAIVAMSHGAPTYLAGRW